MKLKDTPGFPKERGLWGGKDFGYNTARNEIGNLEVKLDKEKIKLIILAVIHDNPMDSILDELPDFMSTKLPKAVAQAISEAFERGGLHK